MKELLNELFYLYALSLGGSQMNEIQPLPTPI
jgi:hypothetical protein